MIDKKAKVIMLPTKDKSNVHVYINGRLFYTNNKVKSTFSKHGYKAQHLYVTVGDKIKQGDYYIDSSSDITTVQQCKAIPSEGLNEEENCRKIVATTDTSLNLYTKGDWDVNEITGGQKYYHLPKIPQSFVEAYVKAGGIDEVMIEYNYRWDEGNVGEPLKEDMIEFPKVDSHNTITIHPIKDSWTREELLEDIESCMIKGMSLGEFRDKWVTN